MFTSILVPLDGSEIAERALPYAEILARSNAQRLVLLRVVQPDNAGVSAQAWPPSYSSLIASKAAFDSAHAEAKAYLADVVSLAIDREIKSEMIVAAGEPVATILKIIDDLGIDTVVMSSHGRAGLGRALRGSVADAVLRRAHVPVLLVPRHAAIAWWDTQPLHLLLPLDGSPLSEAAIPYAAALAETLKAHLVLLRTVGYDQEFNFELFFRDTHEDAVTYLEHIAEVLDARGLRTKIEVREGRALSTILAVAAEYKVHGIVMATHGRGGIQRALFGSNADAVLHAARIPTLIIHPGSNPGELGEPWGEESPPVANDEAKPSFECEKLQQTLPARRSLSAHPPQKLLRAPARPRVELLTPSEPLKLLTSARGPLESDGPPEIV